MSDIRESRLLLAFLYLLTVILLREWLFPILELTGTGSSPVFLLFILFAFILSLLNTKWFITIPLKLLYILWTIEWIYLGSSIISLEILPFMVQTIAGDLSVIQTGKWHHISNAFQTFLFFLILWMLTYLIRYWIEVKRSIFLFYFTTIAFLATVDTFSPYSVEEAIFPVMLVGLLLLGLMTISKLTARYEIPLTFKRWSSFVVPLVFLLVISTVFMISLPKLGPVWADPISFIQSKAEGKSNEGQTLSKSGYSTDDDRLGGPFLQDDSLVFEAAVESAQYWKAETKDTYTSKGWEQSQTNREPATFSSGELMPTDQPTDGTVNSAQLSLTEEFPFILYPYGMMTVSSEQDTLFVYDRLTGKYEPTINGETRPLNAYEFEFTEPVYSLQELRSATLNERIDVQQFEAYLQLPHTLPERVGELAESITSSSESIYEKAKAIERYFSRNGFVYDQTDVAIPEEDEDYVDQFIFDTKKGYCDNFSTSMIVMLRTLDIPARWVKGFAPGEQSTNDMGEQIYRVSNNEAHSWVEAYMPGIGWMPFEPTIGFNGAADIAYDLEVTPVDPALEETREEQQMPEQEVVEETPEENEAAMPKKQRFDIGGWFTSTRLSLLMAAILAIIAFIIYRSRGRSKPKKVRLRGRFKGEGWDGFQARYVQLLSQLDRQGFQRGPGETLKNYALKVDGHFGGEQMQKLTVIYEKGIYGKIEKNEEWQRLQEMWEDLVIKTSN